MIDKLSAQVVSHLEHHRKQIVFAESCTGGLISACLTNIPGASNVLDRSFTVYSNTAKEEILAVPQSLLIKYGAVSRQVAAAMAQGALERSHADIALSVTGIAGPGGATETKPVGLVYIGHALRGQEGVAEKYVFSGQRHEIRLATVKQAYQIVLSYFSKP